MGGGPGGMGGPGGQGGPPGTGGQAGTAPGVGMQGGPPGVGGQSGTQGIPGANGTQMAPPGMNGQSGTQGAPGAGAMGGGPGGGGMFGGGQSLTEVLDYTRANGGGNVAVSSQMSASSSVLAGADDVVAIGGFSGRESEVSVEWLAQAIRDGQIRWVLVDGTGGGGIQDGRVGASAVMAAVAQTCKAVDYSGSGSGTLYDCQGFADALEAVA